MKQSVNISLARLLETSDLPQNGFQDLQRSIASLGTGHQLLGYDISSA